MLYRTILIVDTEVLSFDLCRSALGKLGHRVLGASSGEEAVEMGSTTPIDLVMIDGNQMQT